MAIEQASERGNGVGVVLCQVAVRYVKVCSYLGFFPQENSTYEGGHAELSD